MDTLSYKTKSVNPADVEKKWLLIDVEGQVLGRAASKIAMLLRGKHKASYTPHVDCGDNVIVVNADKIRLTGNKMNTKAYIRHTGYPGGQRVRTVKEQLARKPEIVLEKAIKGMLPKNKLGAQLFRNLKVYAGATHPHEAQTPETYELS